MAAAVPDSRPLPPPVTTPEGIVRLRADLGLSQGQLGTTLNAHQVTVARWEAGALRPDEWQIDLLAAFRRAHASGALPSQDAIRDALQHGAPYALQTILSALPAPRRRL